MPKRRPTPDAMVRTFALCALLQLGGLPARAADSFSLDDRYQFIVADCVVTKVEESDGVLSIEFEGGRRTGTLGRSVVDAVGGGLSMIRKEGISDKDWQKLVASAKAALHKKTVIAIRDMGFTMIRGGCLMFEVPPSKVEIRSFETH